MSIIWHWAFVRLRSSHLIMRNDWKGRHGESSHCFLMTNCAFNVNVINVTKKKKWCVKGASHFCFIYGHRNFLVVRSSAVAHDMCSYTMTSTLPIYLYSIGWFMSSCLVKCAILFNVENQIPMATDWCSTIHNSQRRNYFHLRV